MADATTASPTMMDITIAPTERIEPRRLVAFLIMVFGMFMSILDIQVVSASLTDIQAGLSASSTEVSWVQTAYLIAEVIAIPLSGYLARHSRLSRRGHDPDRVCLRLHGVSPLQIPYRRPDHRPGRDAGADHWPDRRRHHHRPDVVALAVLHQCRAGHHHHRRRARAGRFRRAEF